MAEGSLKRWQAAGLIDEATARRIRAWEAENTRPVGLWAVIGIAALCIGLGIVSLVAANWEAIPGMVRLAIHFIAMIALAGGIAVKARAMAEHQPWLHEAGLFLFGALGMTFLGHIGQVYQTSSPLWQPLTLWLALFAPLLLIEGLSWITATMVMGKLVFTVWNHIFAAHAADETATIPIIRWALEAALPVLVGAGAAWMRGRSTREWFWQRMEQIGLAYAVGGASLLTVFSGYTDFMHHEAAHETFIWSMTFTVVGLAAAVITWLARQSVSGRATAGILAGATLTIALTYPLSGSDLIGGLLFMALWAGIAGAGLAAGWRGVFQLAVGVVAIRLIVLSFELAGDLLMSGTGLIVSGLLILAVAWAAVRVSKRFAPPRDREEEQP